MLYLQGLTLGTNMTLILRSQKKNIKAKKCPISLRNFNCLSAGVGFVT